MISEPMKDKFNTQTKVKAMGYCPKCESAVELPHKCTTLRQVPINPYIFRGV